ncbi:MAG: hypothetical protein IPK70_05105 [Flavobacteriales bacterium]|nr:hypothetical protein [Flavobacteriales bacterium]
MERTLNRGEEQLLELLHGHPGPLGNGKAREQLGWDEDTYNMAKEGLIAQGLVAFGRGRGGSIRLVEPNGPASAPAPAGRRAAERPFSQEALRPEAQKPKASGQEHKQPTASESSTEEPIE